MAHLARNWALISAAATYVSEAALNAKHTPNQGAAATDWAYLTADGSNGALYLDAGLPIDGLTYGGDLVTYGGNVVTYGV